MDTALAQLYDRLSVLEQENAMLRSHLQRCQQTCAVLQAEVAEYKQREQEWQTHREFAREYERQTVDLENYNFPGETLGDSPTETPRDRILEATTAAANALLRIAPLDAAVNTALQIIGECLDTDRISIHENFDHPTDTAYKHWQTLYDWNSPNTIPQVAHPEAGQGSYEPISGWYARMEQGQSINYLIEDAPEPFRSGQVAIGVKATHLVPIFVEGKFWGVVGLDDCRAVKQRTSSEIAVLKIAANCIGSAIQRERTQQALLQAEQARSQELERLNIQLQQTLDHLTQSEQRYRQLMELASEGIFRVEYEAPISVNLSVEEQAQQIYQHYRVVEHNLAFAQMYGYEQPNAMVGTRLTDWHIADAPQNAEQMEQFVRNGHQMRNQETVEFDLFGHKRHFLNNGFSIIRDGYAIGGWGTQIDITELRQTQQALLEAEQARVAELAKANEELQQREQEVQRSYRLLSVVAQVTKDLLEAEDVEIAIAAALQAVGEVANMSRVQLLLEHQDSTTQKLQHVIADEWVAEGIVPQINHPDAATLDNDDFEFMLQDLYVGRSIWRLVDDFPNPIREKFESIGIKSSGTVPIFIEGRYIGGVGFDDCTTPRRWSQQEIDVLTAAAESIGAALHRKQLVDRLVEERIHAEQERVAELKKANEALARTSERLAEQPDLSAFLSHIALEAIAQLGADGAMLSTLDEQRQVLRAVAHVEQGHIPVSTLAAEMPVDEAGFVKVLLETRKPRYFNLEQEAHLFWAGSIEYHHQRNHKAVMGVPLYAGGNFLGHLGLAFTHTEPIKEQGSELLYALAQQAALAIQLTRLAEEAKQAAIAREQEKAAQQRAEQLARANNALQKTVATLTTRRDLDGFIGEVLHTIARELDSPLVEYWTVLGIDTVEVETWIYANQLCSLRQGDDHPSRGGIRLLHEYIGFEDFTQRNQVLTFDAPMPAYSLAAEEVICPTDWYAARGVAKHFNFPLQAGDTTIGSISVWMPFDREISEESLRLGQTLSHQTALAIQLTRLAEEAKQAAIAREQEKAAQERAAELAKANEVLSRTSSRLAEQPNLSAFLGHIMLEAVAQLEADGGHLTIYDQQREMISTAVLVEQGKVVPSPDFPPDMPISEVGFIQLIRETRKLRYFDLEANFEQDAHLLWQDIGEHHKRRKHLVGIAIPLFIGDEFLGHFGLAFTYKKTINEQNIELLQALANQAALAIQLTKLAEEAKQAAIAREQEKAAQQRAAELEKASIALQQTIDAVGQLEQLDAFVPEVLRIVVEAFGANSCAYFEHPTDERIYLRYWFYEGVIYKPDQLLALDAERFSTVRLLSQGFTAPIEYLGTPHRYRKHAVVIDHLHGMAVPEFHTFARGLGWGGELNVPLVCNGLALGALVIYRETPNFTDGEISLAESLSKQISLAMQTSQIADREREMAIAREQEKAAQERAAEFAAANRALQRGVERLVASGTIDAVLDSFLLETVAVTGAAAGAVMRRGLEHEFIMQSLVENGRAIYPFDPHAPEEVYRQRTAADTSGIMRRTAEGEIVVFPVEGIESWFPEAAAYHQQRGHRTIWHFPFRVGGEVAGYLGLAFCDERSPSDTIRETVQALAHQVSLALEIQHLAEEAKQAAIAREQEKAAQQQAAELCRANTLLRKSLSRLSTSPNLKYVLGHLLVELVRYAGASVGHIFIHDATQNTLTLNVRCQDGQAFWTPADDEPVLFRSPISVEHTPIFTNLCAQPRLAILNEDEFEGRMWEGVPQWFEAKGYRGICSCVLMVGDRPFGMLAMAFPQPVAFRSVEEELILALTQQIALVIQLTTLGEADKQAAIAREQEKAAQERAAQLAKANDALKRSLNSLAADQSLDRFLENVMTSLAEQFNSTTAEYWSHRDGETAFLELLTWEGTFYNRDAFAKVHPDHPGLAGYKVPPEMILSEPLDRRTQHFIIEDTSTHPDSFRSDRQWMYKYGIPKEINVPLNVGENTIGAFVVRMQQNVEITTEKVELAWALANQVALALELTRLADEAKQAAIFEERNRMASEIHDTLAQAFTGISLQLEVAKSLVHQDPQTLQQILDHLSRLAETGLAEARRSVWALYPPAAEYADLAQMLYESVEQMARNTSTSVEVNLQGTPCALPPLIGMNLLRIGQEAITNALKHAQAQTITIELSYEPDRIFLTIGDNGCGFTPPTTIDSLNGGFGLMGMYERCDRIGAQLSLTSQLGQGTQILVEAPLS